MACDAEAARKEMLTEGICFRNEVCTDGPCYCAQKIVAAVATESARLRAALGHLVRKGTNGRWYTSQNGDADVTALVAGVLEQSTDQK